MKRLGIIFSIVGIVFLFSSFVNAQILVRCYAHVEDYYTQQPVQGQNITFTIAYSVMLEPEGFPEQVIQVMNGVTNSSGDLYLALLIPVEPVWYSDPFPPTVDWLQATTSGPYTVMSSSGTSGTGTSTLYPTFNVAYRDLDEDQIIDSEELAIAEKFKPVLIRSDNVAHPELQQGLGNFETTINNNSRITISNNIGEFSGPHTNVPNLHKWGNNPWTFCSHGHVSFGVLRFYDIELTLPNPYSGASVGSRPMYYHVYKEGSFYYVQYWYWFNFNDIRNQTMKSTQHQGDWEHISIKLTKDQSGVYSPVMINYFQHEGGHAKTPAQGLWTENWSNWAGVQGLPDSDIGYDEVSGRTHPVLYLASNSHATYSYGENVFRIRGYITFGGVLQEDFKDEVDYSENSSFFEYDQLQKLGEMTDVINQNWHGLGTYYLHAEISGNSKEWLGIRGRLGRGWHDGIPLIGICTGGTGSPKVPSRSGYYNTFKNNSGLFGNFPIEFPCLGIGFVIITWEAPDN